VTTDNPVLDPAISGALTASRKGAWVASPYVHVGPDRLFNPHTDLYLDEGEAGFKRVRGLLDGSLPPIAALEQSDRTLVEAGWITDDPDGLAFRYRLKYVSLEATTACNQSCYFCPVSIAPRESYVMPMEQYRGIATQLAELGEPIEAVFMISYNEPTADPHFIERVRTLREVGLPPATLTNGTGLQPKRVDQLLDIGGLRFLSINLSTIDRDRYRKDRGQDHLELVLRNLEYAKDKPVGERMDIVVLGTGDDTHKADFEAISKRFEGSRFTSQYFVVNDRAGYLDVGLNAQEPKRRLRGCDYMGSRPIQHIHITPRAKCILCCQDYHEKWEVGDLELQTVKEVLVSPAMAQARRQVYGLEDAPEQFLCNNCAYSLH
jgi:hypothetical protein